MQIQILGKNYFLTFIDDYIRMCCIYLLTSKVEAFACFKEFKAHVEKQSEYVVKYLRTNREEDFCSNKFLQYYKYHGIKRQLTTTYTPQQNGMVYMERSMLKSKYLTNIY